jgi:hypothetical protein
VSTDTDWNLRGNTRNSRVVGDKAFFRVAHKMNYHFDERNGRMVWCGCMRAMRINGKPLYPAVQRRRTMRRSKYDIKPVSIDEYKK